MIVLFITKAYGTMQISAPETKGGNTYDGKTVDMWACGILLSIINRELVVPEKSSVLRLKTHTADPHSSRSLKCEHSKKHE